MTNKQLSEDWDLVSSEDVVGYYDDRIILILGADEATYQLLLADIPTSSQLLARVGQLIPCHRYIRLPALDAHMLAAYLHPHSVDALANEFSWNEVIKLVISAEVLEDPAVQTTAIAALKEKARTAKDSLDSMYTHVDYQLAKSHRKTTNGSSKLIQTLDDIAKAVYAKAPKLKSPSTASYTSAPPSKYQPDRQGPGNYTNSVLRGNGLIRQKQNEAEGKEYPVRQPTTPPSVEALRSGTVGNFV
ncbi:uncharacterized protein K460DRAFT_290525 [Cucurbitaria berberidis CBS 394.84]|uniref:Uncharacterized protein n=1 Tax=Cucurbitaria berberidis CBS 394.84 TaxID=1168544 RepID=A0A9P4L6W6_9PLEO|nr:uncharacterized protein K460DRAFT_290525 [Cucurbitaria berberidis CBS 394.84]KAF1843709.1 hypothetical protein K460DRAFT_290525 [Cucurbitaria berberidis CBS 394.84]